MYKKIKIIDPVTKYSICCNVAEDESLLQGYDKVYSLDAAKDFLAYKITQIQAMLNGDAYLRKAFEDEDISWHFAEDSSSISYPDMQEEVFNRLNVEEID